MQDNALLNKLLIFANKFSSQRHITAIRDGFVALIPLTIIASFWVLINNLILSPQNGLLKNVAGAARWMATVKMVCLVELWGLCLLY